MRETSTYKLNQWDKSDRIQMEDFNADNGKVEAALAGLAETMTAGFAKAGNCDMAVMTYTGTGTYGSDKPTRITFEKMPDVFLIVGDRAVILSRGGETAPFLLSDDVTYHDPFVSNANASWNGNTLRLTNGVDSRYQMNSEGKAYWVLALNQRS